MINIIIAVFIFEGCYGLSEIFDIAVIMSGFFVFWPVNNGFTFFNRLATGVTG